MISVYLKLLFKGPIPKSYSGHWALGLSAYELEGPQFTPQQMRIGVPKEGREC